MASGVPTTRVRTSGRRYPRPGGCWGGPSRTSSSKIEKGLAEGGQDRRHARGPGLDRALDRTQLGRFSIGPCHARSEDRLAGAVLAALVLIGVLAWRRTAQWLGTLADATTPLPPLPISAILLSSGLMLVSWMTFGVAFWMLIRGLISTASVPIPAAMGMFALGYVMGLIAVIAPGGLGVRDLALVGFLTPFLGSGGALALSLASRVHLTLTETGAAGIALLLKPAPAPIITEKVSE